MHVLLQLCHELYLIMPALGLCDTANKYCIVYGKQKSTVHAFDVRSIRAKI